MQLSAFCIPTSGLFLTPSSITAAIFNRTFAPMCLCFMALDNNIDYLLIQSVILTSVATLVLDLVSIFTPNFLPYIVSLLFQAACCLNIWLCPFRQFRQCVKKKIQATSKQGMRLRFGMLIALTNIRSTKVLHDASCIIHHASCIIGYF